MTLPLWFRLTLRILERLSPTLASKLTASLFTTPGRHRTPAWEVTLAAKGRSRTIAGIHTTQWGPEHGEPAILIHGWEGRGTQMGFFVEPLVARGIRVIAVDGPAHGATPGKEGGPYHFARALRALQAELGPFRAAVGHSMGGAAITLALGDGLAVGRIVILGSPADFIEVRDRYLHWMGVGPRTRAAFHRELMRRLGLSGNAPSLQQIAATQSLPVLVVHDPDDPDDTEVPVVDGRATAIAYANARLLEMDAGGHRRMLKHPAVVRAVTEFVLGD